MRFMTRDTVRRAALARVLADPFREAIDGLVGEDPPQT
jgi:hypothetical protein